MTALPATALRLGLHLLLAAALLLQATTALAMATGMAGAAAARDAAGQGAVAADPPDDLPPCHAAPAAASAGTATDDPATPGCCDAAGGLCQWACASVPALLAVTAVAAVVAPPMVRPEPPRVVDPRWPTLAPLRPPIT